MKRLPEAVNFYFFTKNWQYLLFFLTLQILKNILTTKQLPLFIVIVIHIYIIL